MGFGTELRSARLAAGMSLAELARRVHFSKGYLSKVETGVAPPNQSLAALCDTELRTDGRLSALISTTPRRQRAKAASSRLFGLPTTTAHFYGRGPELAELGLFLVDRRDAETSGPHTPLCAVHGMAGIGKTALAVRAATRMEAHFPDGCLFLDLHGYQHDAEPVTPATALDRLLRLLGVSGDTIPAGVDDRAAMYRDQLRGKRFLLLFDNVRNTEQVRPLLPAEPRCRVLITSRSRLVSLDDARHVSLDTLEAGEAAGLFSSVAGVDGDPGALTEVVERCGRLPLAVRIAAARHRANPTWTLARLASRLADEAVMLEELDDGERSVTAALRLSYDGLPPQQRRLFGLLALSPGQDLDAEASAALAGCTPREAEQALDQLLDAHLVGQQAPGRYRFHELVRVFAAQRAATELPVDVREQALDRLVDHYVVATDLADRQLVPQRDRVLLDLPTMVPTAPEFAGPDAATAWLDDELSNLVAIGRLANTTGRHRRCWQLTLALGGYFYLAKPWEVWTRTHKLAAESAAADGDRWAEATMYNRLGLPAIELGEYEAASQHYRRALTLFDEIGDEHGATTALANDAWVHHYRGDHERALDSLRTAFDAYRRGGHRRNAAITLRSIGFVAVESVPANASTQLNAAINDLERSLLEFNELDLRLDATITLNNLGHAHERLGEPDIAASRYRQAAVLATSCGSIFEQARADAGLGSVAASLGDDGAAERHWMLALSRYRALRAPQAIEIEDRLRALGLTDLAEDTG
jgi:transcriptional regulator with XRE-family HTH domain/tetratricopeptide (TPR) repeat protein